VVPEVAVRRRCAGLGVLEVTVYAFVSMAVMALASVAFVRFMRLHHETESELWRLEAATRLLESAKRDVRAAESVATAPDGMTVTIGGRSVRYRFDPATGTMETDDGRGWFEAFERVTFRPDGAGVAIEVDLKREWAAAHAPRIETWVRCGGRVR